MNTQKWSVEHSLLWGKWIEWEIRQNSQEETNFLRDAVTRAVGEISKERGKEEEAGYGHGHGHERAYRNRATGFLPQAPSFSLRVQGRAKLIELS